MLKAGREEAAMKKEILAVQKEREIEELKIVKIKRVKEQAECMTAQMKKAIVTAQYNQVLGKNLAIPNILPQ
jgi:hypothetical protein